MSKSVIEDIIHRVKQAKYYAFLLDCTRDVSRVEQMSIILRFCNSSTGTIEEHFVGFIAFVETTGEYITNSILQELERNGLDTQNYRGQGYDNGANMVGINKGVRTRILNINPKAFFTPCGCHSWNLLLIDATNSSATAKTFLASSIKSMCYFQSQRRHWNPPPDVLLQNWGGMEPNSFATYLVLKTAAKTTDVPYYNEFRGTRSNTVIWMALTNHSRAYQISSGHSHRNRIEEQLRSCNHAFLPSSIHQSGHSLRQAHPHQATSTNSIWDGGTLRVPFPSDIQRHQSRSLALSRHHVRMFNILKDNWGRWKQHSRTLIGSFMARRKPRVLTLGQS
ncbi:zinc finger MYM-type protein 1 [Trichonephila clavipes]|nr:zinc finger MYM-type protein 1 [Trichonephila clavipes]